MGSGVSHISRRWHTTSQPLLALSPSFSLDRDEDTHTHTHTKKTLGGLVSSKTRTRLIKYAYGSSANYGQLNFHKGEKRLGLREREREREREGEREREPGELNYRPL